LLEWDDKIPSFNEVHGEALKAKRFLDALTTQSEKQPVVSVSEARA
jgi:uncharacterized protein (UPF0276 family)